MGGEYSKEKIPDATLSSDTRALPVSHVRSEETPPTCQDSKISRDESSDEEKESFVGWLSSASEKASTTMSCVSADGTSRKSRVSDSKDNIGEFSAAMPSTGQTHTHRASAPSSNDLQSTTSSTNWIGQRPSLDTPLRHSSAYGHRQQDQQQRLEKKEIECDKVCEPSESEYHQHARQSDSSNRSSRSSTGRISGPQSGTAASARSSFAIERASLEANRSSIEAFREAHCAQMGSSDWNLASVPKQAFDDLEDAGSDGANATLDLILKSVGLGSDVRDSLGALCVLPAQTPAPASMFSRLWNISYEDTLSLLKVFSTRSVVNTAVLSDGETWAMPQPQQLQLIKAACEDLCHKYHSTLIDSYISRGSKEINLDEIDDDGYIMANIGHHLVGASRFCDLRSLLLNPAWLDKKLMACGPGPVVADYRRYLQHSNERDVKVVLEAFQMSVGLVGEYKASGIPGMLRCLMYGRLMTVPLSSKMQNWLKQQEEWVKYEGSIAISAGLTRCLPPTTPSLDQAGGLQRLVFKGHKGPVTKVLLTPSGTEVISVSSDGSARLWDLEIGDCVLKMEGHIGPITDIDMSADGSLIITASEDGTARAYELERGQCLRVLSGHKGAITALKIDPLGRFVITGGVDGTAHVSDLGSARPLHIVQVNNRISSISLSPCTRYALLGCSSGVVYLIDVISGQTMGAMKGHTASISSVQFLPDGKRSISASHDGTLCLWSINSCRCIRTYQGHTGRVNGLDVSKDGSIFASASDDKTVRIWSSKSDKCLMVLKGHKSWVNDVALSKDSDRLLSSSGDGTAIAWSLDAGEPICVLEGHSGAVLSAILTRRGRFAVTASDDSSLRVWDFKASSGHTPKWHEGCIHALAASDGVIVATAGDDCVARIWDASLGEYRGILKGHSVPIRWAFFSSDGSQLVTASPDHEVRIWDASTLELLHCIPSQKGSRMKSFAACVENLRFVCMCLFDGTVTMWDVKESAPVLTLQARGVRDEQYGHTSAVNEVLINRDGSRVVTLSKDYTGRIWDAQDGSCLQVLRGHTNVIVGGCLAEEGNVLATYSFDKTVRLWDMDTGHCLNTVALKRSITKLALSKCGRRIACATSNNSVILCDVDKGKEHGCTKISGHRSDITGVSFSNDGSLLATSSLDCTVRLIDFSNASLKGIFVSDCGLTCCHFDSVTGLVIAGTDRGVVHFIDASSIEHVTKPKPILGS